jgi:hypothetical protein
MRLKERSGINTLKSTYKGEKMKKLLMTIMVMATMSMAMEPHIYYSDDGSSGTIWTDSTGPTIIIPDDPSQGTITIW